MSDTLLKMSLFRCASASHFSSRAFSCSRSFRRLAAMAFIALLHPFLSGKMRLGLVPHIQARLLARHLRGDHDLYPELIWK